MNVKELLVIVLLALATTWGIEYLFFKKRTDGSDEPKSGQSFVAPKTPQELRPINTEIDFVDSKRPAPAELTHVETNQAFLTFSTDGASLERLEFKKRDDGTTDMMTTIFPVADTEKDKRCFLVALQEQTPFYYSLVSHQDIEHAVILKYQAESPLAVIHKTFIVSKLNNKIDIELTIVPKGQQSVEARLFYPAPIIADIISSDPKSAILNDEKGSITSIARSKINPDMFWVSPSLFGVDDRYFVHTLFADPAKFVQRGFYKLEGQHELYAIIEGPLVKQEQAWTVSFYMGPKEEKAVQAVDPRLEQTLGYAGWLAPISKWLLAILNFLYSYLKNYGWAIIVLTILTKIVLLPFAIKSAQGMKKHGEIQRKLKYVQQKYQDDPEALAREKADIMRKEGLSSLAGCLPLLLQLPIFFALNRVLSTSIELYKAPFLWIHDLSATDPYYILPLLVVITMLLQAMTVDSTQRLQIIIMAIIFGAITTSLSAGLCLFIFVSTLLGVIQTYVQNKLKVA